MNFNSHAHVERDLKSRTIQRKQRHFNSHAHVERDIQQAQGRLLFSISTHTLTWSVTCNGKVGHFFT